MANDKISSAIIELADWAWTCGGRKSERDHTTPEWTQYWMFSTVEIKSWPVSHVTTCCTVNVIIESLPRTSPQGVRIPGFPNNNFSVKLWHTKKDRLEARPIWLWQSCRDLNGPASQDYRGQCSGQLTHHYSSSLWVARQGEQTHRDVVSLWSICIKASWFLKGEPICFTGLQSLMFMSFLKVSQLQKHCQWKA